MVLAHVSINYFKITPKILPHYQFLPPFSASSLNNVNMT